MPLCAAERGDMGGVRGAGGGLSSREGVRQHGGRRRCLVRRCVAERRGGWGGQVVGIGGDGARWVRGGEREKRLAPAAKD